MENKKLEVCFTVADANQTCKKSAPPQQQSGAYYKIFLNVLR